MRNFVRATLFINLLVLCLWWASDLKFFKTLSDLLSIPIIITATVTFAFWLAEDKP